MRGAPTDTLNPLPCTHWQRRPKALPLAQSSHAYGTSAGFECYSFIVPINSDRDGLQRRRFLPSSRENEACAVLCVAAAVAFGAALDCLGLSYLRSTADPRIALDAARRDAARSP